MSVEQLGVRDVPGRAVVARLEGIDVILPVKKETNPTAVAYHPVDNPNTVPFSPAGETREQERADSIRTLGSEHRHIHIHDETAASLIHHPPAEAEQRFGRRCRRRAPTRS